MVLPEAAAASGDWGWKTRSFLLPEVLDRKPSAEEKWLYASHFTHSA